MKKVMAIVCVALAVLAATCSAALTFQANFRMTNKAQFPNGYVTGIVYYHYDGSNLQNCRIRFETYYRNAEGVMATHTDLYHYGNAALYTFCDGCDASVLGATPDAWYKLDTDTCDDEGQYKRCYRGSTGSTSNLIEFLVKGTPGQAGFDLKYVKFLDGREYELSDLHTISASNTKFQLSADDNCPTPQCRSYVDVVFVLDASSSVSSTSWGKQVQFLKKATQKFTISGNDANVGIVQFAAPYHTCCRPNDNGCHKEMQNNGGFLKKNGNYYGKWQTYVCDDADLNIRTNSKPKRYLDDCVFDLRCNNETDSTAVVTLGLSDSSAAVESAVNGLSTSRISGHTCQRYGLVKAYDMLFNNNARCPPGADKSGCPVPIVIAITDGWDLCHASTEEWAMKIRNADSRGLLLEVGVGLYDNFDRNYLKSLSSEIAGSSGNFNVDSYDEMDSILEKLMEPACSMGYLNGTSSCGSSCKGYCACSECFCPQCSEDAPNCNEYVCSDVAASLGCREQETVCHSGQVEDKLCFNEFCSPEDGECKIEPVDCAGPYEEAHSRTLKQCESIPCSNGCASEPVLDHEFCNNLVGTNCSFGRCSPLESTDESGCVTIPKSCNVADFPGCHDAQCDNSVGCYGITCDTACYWNRDGLMVPKCPKKDCIDVTCNEDATSEDERCIETPHVCEQPNNKCQKSVCYVENGENLCKIVEDKTILNCSGKNKKDGCRTWRCDADADNEDGSKGACVFELEDHKQDNCIDYECGDDDLWHAIPRCTSDKKCKISRCNDADGSCFEVDVDCRGKVRLPNKCFEAACKEPDGCYKKQYRGAYFDVCGRCISANEGDSAISYSDEESTEDCVVTSEEDLPTEGLAAAAVALIVVGVIILGAAIALSSVVGTKALIDRARGASDQAVVSNPLFEDSQTEMTNPAFMGEA